MTTKQKQLAWNKIMYYLMLFSERLHIKHDVVYHCEDSEVWIGIDDIMTIRQTTDDDGDCFNASLVEFGGSVASYNYGMSDADLIIMANNTITYLFEEKISKFCQETLEKLG